MTPARGVPRGVQRVLRRRRCVIFAAANLPKDRGSERTASISPLGLRKIPKVAPFPASLPFFFAHYARASSFLGPFGEVV